MMTLRQDLIAARALIDTPAKWAALDGLLELMITATGEDEYSPRVDAALAAIGSARPSRKQTGRKSSRRMPGARSTGNDYVEITGMIDRAINEAP